MHLNGLLDALSDTTAFNTLVTHWQTSRHSPWFDQGVVRSARPYVVAGLAQALGIPVLVVTARVERAHDMAEQLLVWLPETPVLRLQEPSSLFYERAPWTETTIRARLQTLAALTPPPLKSKTGPDLPAQVPPIIVTSALALMQKTLPARDFRVGSRQIYVGQQIDPDKLLQHWVSVGYQSASVITTPGTFSRRGGIIDVYPAAADTPIRMEFFGDEVESLRTFDPATQRSIQSLDTFLITPAREVLPKTLTSLIPKLNTWFASQPETEITGITHDAGALESGTAFPYAEFYLPYLYQNAASVLDYLPEDALVIVEDWAALRDTIAELEGQALELREDKLDSNLLPPDMPVAYHTWDDLQDELVARFPLHLAHAETITESDDVLGDLFAPGQRFGGQLRLFLDHLQTLTDPGSKVVVVTRQAQRVAEVWSERIDKALHPWTEVDDFNALKAVTFVEGELAEGWTLQTANGRHLHVVTDAEIFGWKRPEPRRRIQKRSVSPEAYYADLDEGDYVVHVDYGIGCFRGIQKRRLQETEREYLIVEYGGGDVLYVPIHQADRLSKYVGSQSHTPTLNRLGSQDWAKTKKSTEQAVEEVAEELLDLYAARSVVQGYSFAPDTPWQHELEASFPYVETEDQLRALREVKADMESARPMDRLICGDAGYGKTEIALRAAFKAVMDGKQVAVLVPTTVLAQQHFNTFTQRLAVFPINVQMLSRFRSKAEQEQIVQDAADGKVDILIGTHRMLQEDVRFKNLGLLTIDEEQRFGVTHKERLKRMRTEVDVLTMTATPIPRTLYMGLTGLRDISLIQTPPEERLPPINHVGPYDDKMIRQAILREIDRGGQVFFVHNRVNTIYSVTEKLQQLVPEATFAVGHGQMDEHQLEDVMLAFAEDDCDVLVSTTIIENGIDIPNANTIILDRADRFGLSQLYQLRGRVGRSSQQAYVYFFHPHNTPLTPDARARLDTISEYTDLGAGMSIAVRDLEIRGMGDLLGMRQSGYIDAVGLHLYTRLLTDSVQKIKTDRPRLMLEPTPLAAISMPVTIDLPLPAYIPTDFMPDMGLRIQLYRRIASVETIEDVDAMEAELQDRFGSLPRAVQGLLYQMRVKLLTQQVGATAIATESGKIGIRLPYLGSVDRDALQDHLGNDVRVSRVAVWLVTETDDPGWQTALVEVLQRLKREDVSIATGL